MRDTGVEAGPPLSPMREEHTATVLGDGSVLVVGGRTTPTDVDRFDPVTGVWSAAAALPVPRCRHVAITLADGRVLVVGGSADTVLTAVGTTDALVYDPAADAWRVIAPLAQARRGHTATLLRDGRVIVIGGTVDQFVSPTAVTEILDPATMTWSAGPSLATARRIHTATTLDDGSILVVGGAGERHGATNEYPTTAERLLADATAFEPAGTPGPRSDHVSVLLADGRVLVASGVDASWRAVRDTLLHDPRTGEWARGAPMSTAPATAVGVLAPDGTVAVVGGFVLAAMLSDHPYADVLRYAPDR